MNKYTIRPTVSEEALESWIWTNDDCVSSKGFVVIRNLENKKTIKTFKRTLDENFEKIYNERNTFKIDLNSGKLYLVINEYYRTILGVEKHQEIDLQIGIAKWYQRLFRIHWSHPNPTVQFANRATLMSIIIGAIALLLTFYSIYITLKTTNSEFCLH